MPSSPPTVPSKTQDMLPKAENPLPATIHFLSRSPLFATEKPYSLRFPPDPSSDVAQTNIKTKKHTILMHNMRHQQPAPSVEINGFQVMKMESKMSYSNFEDEEMVKGVYLSEVETALMRELGGKRVHVMDFAVRRRHSTFPISTGKEFETLQPAALAHIDFTVREGERLIEIIYGERAVELLRGHWQIINVWRPLRGPLNDWPLGLCDAQSVDFRNDIMAGDIVYEDFVTENLQAMHNMDQKWFYLPDQTTKEVLIFKSADSEHSDAPAFYNPKAAADERLAKASIAEPLCFTLICPTSRP